jgi:transcriptional regulator with AAA-type ATPase domain
MFLSSESDERIIAEVFGFSKGLVEAVCNQQQGLLQAMQEGSLFLFLLRHTYVMTVK